MRGDGAEGSRCGLCIDRDDPIMASRAESMSAVKRASMSARLLDI
ncbi:UNVERIFIED_ORG: hypothetical protein M2328_003984 [Rhodococcus erythropolis]